MSSRNYLKHSVSTNTPPLNGNLGDEWYNPTNNKLYKLVANSGITVQWAEVGAGASQISSTTVVPEGINLYYTDARVVSALSPGFTTKDISANSIVANSIVLSSVGNTYFGSNAAVISSDTDLYLTATGNLVLTSGYATRFGVPSSNNAILTADGNVTINAGYNAAVVVGNSVLRFKSYSTTSNIISPYYGDTFFNSTSNVLQYYNGNIWAEVGYRTQPVSNVSLYTFANTDIGKIILHSMNSIATVWTIPAGIATGAVFTLINDNAAGVVTVYAPFDYLGRSGNSTVGNVLLQPNTVATFYKILPNKWFVSGIGYSSGTI
jgi:hypothetical protein